MGILVKDIDTLDINGSNIIWNNTVNRILFYDTRGESWDRSGGENASWYLENSLPNDSFVGTELNADRWSYFNYRGTVSGTINDYLQLSISGSCARGGITSEGKWKLSGDFDLRLYFDESSYYNEYRGSSATGLTVSLDESTKIRVCKYFDMDREEIGYAVHSVNSYPLKYVLWSEEAYETSLGEDDITCFRIVRTSNEISVFVSTANDFVQIGNSFSDSCWEDPLFVEIEVESEQFNYYSSKLLGLSVSGTLENPQVFSNSYRGVSSEFPETALLVVDNAGLSILDASNETLWMRFLCSSSYMFKNVDCKLAASNGNIYYTVQDGVVVLDFVNDVCKKYTSSNYYKTRTTLAQRNYSSTLYEEEGASFILGGEVLSVAAANISGHDYFVFEEPY